MKEILVNIRDFSYLWTKRQMGNLSGNEKVRYKTKFYYVVGIYYFTFLGLALYFYRKFFKPDMNVLLGANAGLKIVLAAAVIYLPVIVIGNALLRSISAIPVTDTGEDFAGKRRTYVLAVLTGFALLVLSVYMTTLLGKV
ncbi:hypothetical protein [Leadbetterella sp. DM7]|uniref:hypothetical protein n=1 Tax=Leadbetterella sp. DM7 TaxID=3235085 RepID=UPI00349F045E